MTVERRQPRQRRSEQTVASIIAATRTLLQQRDATELTNRIIAAEAGLSPAVIYRYFVDVDAVIDAVLTEHSRIAEAMVAQTLAASRHRTVAGVFEHVARAYLDLYRSQPELTVVWHSASLSERQRQIEARSDDALAGALGRHLAVRGMITELTAQAERVLAAQWLAAGALIGASLRAAPSHRGALEAELFALLRHFASRW